MKFWDNYVKLIIAQGIIAIIVILFVLILRFCFKEEYKDFKNWYIENAISDTDVYEVVE